MSLFFKENIVAYTWKDYFVCSYLPCVLFFSKKSETNQWLTKRANYRETLLQFCHSFVGSKFHDFQEYEEVDFSRHWNSWLIESRLVSTGEYASFRKIGFVSMQMTNLSAHPLFSLFVIQIWIICGFPCRFITLWSVDPPMYINQPMNASASWKCFDFTSKSLLGGMKLSLFCTNAWWSYFSIFEICQNYWITDTRCVQNDMRLNIQVLRPLTWDMMMSKVSPFVEE